MFDIGERRTTGHVEQRVVESDAEATTDRCLSINSEVSAIGVCQAIAALNVGALKIPFDTEDKLTELPVVASVRAADEAIRIVVLIEAGGQAGSGEELVVRLSPQA